VPTTKQVIRRKRYRLAAAAGWLWRALLLLNTLGLLSVGVYTMQASPAEGPSATPMLMAGLLSLCVIVLAVLSAVNAVLWACSVRWPWSARLALVALAPVGPVVVFLLVMAASHPEEAGPMKWLWLSLFVLTVMVTHALNARAIRRYRRVD